MCRGVAGRIASISKAHSGSYLLLRCSRSLGTHRSGLFLRLAFAICSSQAKGFVPEPVAEQSTVLGCSRISRCVAKPSSACATGIGVLAVEILRQVARARCRSLAMTRLGTPAVNFAG